MPEESARRIAGEINPDTGELESRFRERVRHALGLHWDAREQTIIDEIERLKACAERTETVGQYALRITGGEK